MASFLCRFFGIGCPPVANNALPVPPPVLPPTNQPSAQKGVGLVVCDESGKGIPNAQATLDGAGQFPLTNQYAYAYRTADAYLTASQLTISALGYQPYSVHVDLPANAGTDLLVGPQPIKPGQIALPGLKSINQHVDPMQFSLRKLARVRGAMWTVRGPWHFGPRPGQDDNITALEFIYSYGSDPFNLTQEQKDMIAAVKSKGFTHTPFGPINAQSYHGQYPDQDFTTPEAFERWLDWLQMFWDNGLAPICFLHGDNQSFEETVAMYDHLIRGNARAQRLMRIVVPTGWEPTQYGWSSRTWGAFADWAADILPNALILIHTVADVDAPVGTDSRYDDNGKPNAQGWAYVCPRIHGWLVQTSAFNDPDGHGDPNHPQNTNFDNWSNLFDKNVRGSYYDRFHNGYAGWPTNSKWGNEPIYIYAGEFCSYWEYWNNRPYAEGVKWGDRAISVGADGVLDSCSIDVPPERG